jgi:sugar transferase EpsL
MMYNLMMKRSMDLSLALVLLVLLLPVFTVISVLIWFSMGWPIIFCQQRPGYKARIFNIFKFRTMAELKDEQGNLLEDGKRLTPLGVFLRRSSLDELPELFNVIKGEMSLVGPRPLLPQYLSRYSKEQSRRHDVKPGVTGWAQVNGRNAISWEDKFKLDLWYVDNSSFWLDLKILILTLGKSLAREGINQPGVATAEEFKGKEQI